MRCLKQAAFFLFLCSSSAWAQTTAPTFDSLTLSGTNGLFLSGTTLSLTGTNNANLTIKPANAGQILFASSNGTQVSIANNAGTVAPTTSILMQGGNDAAGAFIKAVGPAAAVLNLQAGASGTDGRLNVFPYVTLNNSLQGPNALTLTSGQVIKAGTSSQPAMLYNVSWTGKLDAGGPSPYFFQTNDAVDASAAPYIPTWWLFTHQYNTGAGGGRTPIVMVFNKNANSILPGEDNTFVGLTVKGTISANEGDSTTYKTYFGALNLDNICDADWLRVCIQAEIDHGLTAGHHARTVSFIAMNNHQLDGAHGDLDDNFIQMQSAQNIVPGQGARTTLFQLGSTITTWPLDPTLASASILTIHPYQYNNPKIHNLGIPPYPIQMKAGFGIDLFYANFTTAAWRSPGFMVDGAGQINAGPSTFTYDPSGNMTIQVTKVRELSATINNAGDHYQVGDQVVDSQGGFWTVSTISGSQPTGPVTAVTQLRAAYATSCPAAGNKTTAGSGQNLTLNITCSALGATILDGNLKFNDTIVMRNNTVLTAGTAMGPGGGSPAAIWEDIGWSGTLNAGGSPTSYNFIRVRDTVASTVAVMPLLVDQELNAGFDGNRYNVQMLQNKNATSVSGTFSTVNLAIFSHIEVGEGGTAGNYAGGYKVVNPDLTCNTGDYIVMCSVDEHDLRLFAGSHAQFKTNLQLHWAVNDAVHGDVTDTGLVFSKAGTIAPGTGGGLTVIDLGQANADWPLDQNAANTAIMTVKPNTFGNLNYPWQPRVSYGFDLSMINFTSYAWRSTGLWIDGSGQIPILGPGAITYSASGVKFSVPNVVETSATVASGGVPLPGTTALSYRVNDILRDSIGGLWTVTAITGTTGKGAVTGVSLLKPGYAAVAPTNPVATVGGGSQGATLNVTTATTGTLTLGDTGQFVSFASPVALSNTVVASLPTCNAGAKFRTYIVSDANAPTYNATLAGGGAVVALAVCDGANWKAH